MVLQVVEAQLGPFPHRQAGGVRYRVERNDGSDHIMTAGAVAEGPGILRRGALVYRDERVGLAIGRAADEIEITLVIAWRRWRRNPGCCRISPVRSSDRRLSSDKHDSGPAAHIHAPRSRYWTMCHRQRSIPRWRWMLEPTV